MVAEDTASKLLAVAEALVQQRGYNAFSYRDLADRVGVRTASIHYHFPTKADLGRAMIVRYRQGFETARNEIDRHESTAVGKMGRIVSMMRDTLMDDDKLCLACMLAAESGTLPDKMQDEVGRFFAENELWLAQVLDDGRTSGELQFAGDAKVVAKTIFASLEGAMMTARAFKDPTRLTQTAQYLVGSLVRRE